MESRIKLAVHGAAGRMGRRVVALAAEDPLFTLVAAVEQPGHPLLSQDAGIVSGVPPASVPITDHWGEDADVVIDFSLPQALGGCLDHCLATATPLVIATTGLGDEAIGRIRQASQRIPVVWAPSMSLAVNLTMRLAQRVAATLRDVAGGLDVEIIERHHRFKADAPSGTALRFGELIAEKLGPATRHVHGRQGATGQRGRDEIGYHAVRVGDNPGEHTIVFGMMGEKIELNVAASNRDCYASGALAAAKWVQGRGAGCYDMFDVLGMAASG